MIRENKTQKYSLIDNTSMKKLEWGSYDFRMPQDTNIILCKWHDNSIVTSVTNDYSMESIHNVKRCSPEGKKEGHCRAATYDSSTKHIFWEE